MNKYLINQFKKMKNAPFKQGYKFFLVFVSFALILMTICVYKDSCDYSKDMNNIGDIYVKKRCLYIGDDLIMRFIPVKGGNLQVIDSNVVRNIYVESFMMSEIEVPNLLIAKVLRNEYVVDNAAEKYLSFPANNGTKENWLQFIEKLNKKTGYRFRLPTNDEWEYAARGGRFSKNYKYAGSNDIDEVAQYKGNTDSLYQVVSRLRKPNELGFFDMSGGMWELTSTLIEDYDYDTKTLIKMVMRDSLFRTSIEDYSNANIVRGGAYDSPAEECELDYVPRKYIVKTGARLVLDY